MPSVPFTIQAQFSRYTSTADRGMSLTFRTAELPAEQQAIVASHVQREGWVLFADSPIQDDSIPSESAVVDGAKSQSQRLRAVLFLLWKKQVKDGKCNDSCDEFYRKSTEQIIEHYKQKLD